MMIRFKINIIYKFLHIDNINLTYKYIVNNYAMSVGMLISLNAYRGE